MANQAGESTDAVLKFDLERDLKLRFCASVITSDAGLFHTANSTTEALLGLTEIAIETLADGTHR